MSLRNRIGTFFLLAAAIFLFIFAASVFSPTGEYEVMALAAGAVLLVVGWRWRMAKGGGAPWPPRGAAPARAPAAAPPPAPAPKKQGRLGTLLKGPGKKAPAGGPPGGKSPAGGGGKPKK